MNEGPVELHFFPFTVCASFMNGSVSGTTFTPDVNLNGALVSAVGNVSSTKYAVQPRFGASTLPTRRSAAQSVSCQVNAALCAPCCGRRYLHVLRRHHGAEAREIDEVFRPRQGN